MGTGPNRILGVQPTSCGDANASFVVRFASIGLGAAMSNAAPVTDRRASRNSGARLRSWRGFYQQVPAYWLADDLGVDPKVISRVYQKLRAALFHVAELEGMASKLSGEIELDEAYFGGRRKGHVGRGAAGKSVVFGLLEQDGRMYTEGGGACVGGNPHGPHLDHHPQRLRLLHDAFRGYQSLRRYGKHHTVNHKEPGRCQDQEPYQRNRRLLVVCQAYFAQLPSRVQVSLPEVSGSI